MTNINSLPTEDLIKATGALELVLTGEDGQVKDRINVNNLVVTVGKNFIASRMVGTASTVMSHMAVGTSNTAPAAGNTTLGTEVGRAAFSVGASATNNVVSYTAIFGPGTGTGALVEAGIFNAGAAGTMLARTVFAAINKGASDSLTINWNITIN